MQDLNRLPIIDTWYDVVSAEIVLMVQYLDSGRFMSCIQHLGVRANDVGYNHVRAHTHQIAVHVRFFFAPCWDY